MKNLVVIGANSEIAKHTIFLWAKDFQHLIFFSRDVKKLHKFKKNLLKSYPNLKITIKFFDAEKKASFLMLKKFINSLDSLDFLFIAYGFFINQENLENHADGLNRIKKIIYINYLSVVNVIELFVSKFIKQQFGKIVVISSVAGDRGRRSNYIYGSSKSGLTAYLSGLRQRLLKDNIQVITVKPGIVNTPMIQNEKIPNFIISDPKTVAYSIVKGVKNNNQIIYSPFYWKPIMAIIKMIPEFLFKFFHKL